MITVEEAINSLYEKAGKVKYKATAYWTTDREFTPSFNKIEFKQEFQQPVINKEFVLEELKQIKSDYYKDKI
jgi:indole-3-glycerol phosphate synthase